MKQLASIFQTLLLTISVCSAVAAYSSPGEALNNFLLVNRIEGIVWDPDGRPVRDLYVELQNENYTAVARTRTDTAGRFSFIGVSAGHFNIKVITSGTNYQEYTTSVELLSVVRGGNDQVYLEIPLKIDKTKLSSGAAEITDAIFVQDVPEEAQKLYKKGVKNLQKGDLGFSQLEESLKIFPTYFAALNTLGTEYVARKEYQKSLDYLIRAVDVNQRSFSTYYALAYACYELDHKLEAREAARAATILQPRSFNAQLLYGTLLRLDHSYEKAEVALKEASKLSEKRPVPEVHWQLALLYNKLGRNAEAADELEIYLKLLPNAPDRKGIENTIAKLRKDSSKKKFVSVIR